MTREEREDCISRKEVIELAEWFDLNPQHFCVANLIDEVENMPAVKAIPLDRVEQILSEIDVIKCGDWVAVQTVRDMLSMLTEIQLETESLRFGQPLRKYVVDECLDIIQQKIDKLKEVNNER